MRRMKTLSFLLGLSAQFTTVWLALAPGLVLCMEEDGRIAVEISIKGGGCGDTSSVAFSHCDGCQDVPLHISHTMAAEHQHAELVAAVPAMAPELGTLLATRPEPTSIHPTRALWVAARGTTILRI